MCRVGLRRFIDPVTVMNEYYHKRIIVWRLDSRIGCPVRSPFQDNDINRDIVTIWTTTQANRLKVSLTCVVDSRYCIS